MSLSFRFSLAFLLAAITGAASAVGLGDLRAQPSLGDRFDLTVALLGVEKSPPDVTCFRLVRPSQADVLPWLRDAELRVASGRQPALEIRSTRVLREPLMQLAVHLACGYEVQREYTLLASPRTDLLSEDFSGHAAAVASKRAVQHDLHKSQPSGTANFALKSPAKTSARVSEAFDVSARNESSDRLLLSGGAGGESALRLEKIFEQQLIAAEGDEKRRALLRKEFQLLMALQEKTGSDLQAIEKLGNMEAMLRELRKNIQGLSDASVVTSPEVSSEAVQPVDARSPVPLQGGGDVQSVGEADDSSVSDWMLYGLLIGVVLGIAGWLSWGAYRDQKARRSYDEDSGGDLLAVVNRSSEGGQETVSLGRRASPVLPVSPNAAESSEGLVVTHDELVLPGAASASPSLDQQSDVVPSPVVGLAPEESPDVSPVMELADIMLSFGRVKGAAQALQEYVDNNPQEALQPWIRLMDVYRMAGMREEFERVAHNLNQNFNVEIQSWDVARAAGSIDVVFAADAPVPGGKPAIGSTLLSVEEMPGIIASIVRMWNGEDVVGYLYQLLRDNRGGQRQGFPMPVVEEILFLIELKETANRMGEEAGRRG